ncbi:MAG: serine/threonine dehydratase [Blastomonas sp. CACIA14H2]|uniref:threonine ammonia-lyase n=1 Tax=Blastomonas sp. CACIA14H2 TaxID=1419876 RepID=UPI0003D04586|nr:MAG: serine/threonine dehydratase [Blastomonas sp. CACIA14H2]
MSIIEPSKSLVKVPDIRDIRAAAKRIARHATVTPLLESLTLNELVGGRVLVKAENLQQTGSFKFRGAVNRLMQLTEEERSGGVVAYSSGNHAQALALAARLFDTTAVIVMPTDAPRVKVAKTLAYGGEVVFYDRYKDDRAAVGIRLAAERGLTLVPPYDDPYVMAGQGTVGLEVARQAAEMGAKIDALLVCCSGGGLTAGCALAMEADSPSTAIYSVEPEGFDDTARSLVARERVANVPGPTSVCDAVLVDKPGELTFPVNLRLLAGGLAVSDAEALDAVALAYDELKIVVEPGGAVGLAAVLSRKLDCRGKTVAVVCSGGNVDADVFKSIIDRVASHEA